MCHGSALEFGKRVLSEMNNVKVLEVGSFYVNGSVRGYIAGNAGVDYCGVDIIAGNGVDEVCSAENLLEKFGKECFDVVVSTEMLEHVEDWRTAINNMKGVLKAGGVMVITTRSKGFGIHGYPSDYWRYEIEDMEKIFADFEIEILEKDTEYVGVFLKAKKPMDYKPVDLTEVQLYAIK